MSKRYSISGTNSTILGATFDVTGKAGDATVMMFGQALLGRTLPTGRVFWLRSAWFYDASTAVLIHLFDSATGVQATGSNKRITIRCASGSTTMVDFPAPGLKFATGCVAAKESTDASGCFAAGYCGGAGYEE
jgi:hypothetical protein